MRPLILPGLGDIYLGHRALGVLELIGSLFVWLIVITSLLAGGEGSLEMAIFLLVIYNGRKFKDTLDRLDEQALLACKRLIEDLVKRL